jgi:hypothetical protein
VEARERRGRPRLTTGARTENGAPVAKHPGRRRGPDPRTRDEAAGEPGVLATGSPAGTGGGTREVVEPAQRYRTERLPNGTERNRTCRTLNTGRERDGGTATVSQPDVSRLTAGPGLRAEAPQHGRSSQDTNARVTSPMKSPTEEARKVRDPGMDAPDADWDGERSRTAADLGRYAPLGQGRRGRRRTHRPARPGEEPGGRTCFGAAHSAEERENRPTSREPNRTRTERDATRSREQC